MANKRTSAKYLLAPTNACTDQQGQAGLLRQRNHIGTQRPDVRDLFLELARDDGCDVRPDEQHGLEARLRGASWRAAAFTIVWDRNAGCARCLSMHSLCHANAGGDEPRGRDDRHTTQQLNQLLAVGVHKQREHHDEPLVEGKYQPQHQELWTCARSSEVRCARDRQLITAVGLESRTEMADGKRQACSRMHTAVTMS